MACCDRPCQLLHTLIHRQLGYPGPLGIGGQPVPYRRCQDKEVVGKLMYSQGSLNKTKSIRLREDWEKGMDEMTFKIIV